DQDTRIIARAIAAVGAYTPPSRRGTVSHDLHASTKHVARSRLAYQPQAQPVIPVSDLVDQKPRRAVVVRDDDVGITIVVDVAESGSTAHLEHLERLAGPARDILESSAA